MVVLLDVVEGRDDAGEDPEIDVIGEGALEVFFLFLEVELAVSQVAGEDVAVSLLDDRDYRRVDWR